VGVAALEPNWYRSGYVKKAIRLVSKSIALIVL
jgi:hypothetical protein